MAKKAKMMAGKSGKMAKAEKKMPAFMQKMMGKKKGK